MSELHAIEKAVDDLHARIRQLEAENYSLRFSYSELHKEKEKLKDLFVEMEQRYLYSKDEEAEAADRQLDAECDLIGRERDELQNKLVELEATCRQQTAEIETLRSNSPLTVPGLRTVVDSLKAKLGLEE